MNTLTSYIVPNKKWHSQTLYSIPVNKLLGVRSAVAVRKLSMYSKYINKFLNNEAPTTPCLCFIAGDGMLRVKHGNLLYWCAKETNTVHNILCVFAGGSTKTDSYLEHHKEELGIEGKYL